MTLERRQVVRVPASTANLGPGFDVLAAALALHLQLEVRASGHFAVHTDLPVARDRTNLVVRAFERLHPADEVEFRIDSPIPLSGGLGSSAAAVVAGLLAAKGLFELDADVEALAAQLEGHPDNVAAALHGGVVICRSGRTSRFEAPPGLEAVLVVPQEAVSTARARAALPAEVTLSDAVFNVAHAATLILGLLRGDPELIADGLADRLHQPYRAALYPRSAALVGRAGALGALGATISGAGPAVLVWTFAERAAEVRDALLREAGEWARVVPVSFEAQGADVREP